jgi:hypothetical protein
VNDVFFPSGLAMFSTHLRPSDNRMNPNGMIYMTDQVPTSDQDRADFHLGAAAVECKPGVELILGGGPPLSRAQAR